MSPMNFQMSPKAKESRYEDAVLQHGWGILLIIHIHSFWVTPSISHLSQWQLHARTTSNCSVPDIWASSFHKLGKKKIDYCNLGTVSVLSFRILLACVQLLQLYPEVVQKWLSYPGSQSILWAPSETPANLAMVLFSARLHTSAECAGLLLGNCLLPQPTYQSGLAYRRENYSKK